MTSDKFRSIIGDHLDKAIRGQGFSKDAVIDHGATFSTVLGSTGNPGLGNLSAILAKFQANINDHKTKLGLSRKFDWQTDLKTATIPSVVDYYLLQSVTTLISDTVTFLLTISSAVS